MRTWKFKLKIKDLLSNSESVESAQQTGKGIAARLRASSWYKQDVKNVGGDRFDSELEKLADEFSDTEDVEHLNDVLSSLYDLADHDACWIE